MIREKQDGVPVRTQRLRGAPSFFYPSRFFLPCPNFFLDLLEARPIGQMRFEHRLFPTPDLVRQEIKRPCRERALDSAALVSQAQDAQEMSGPGRRISEIVNWKN